MYLFTGAGAIKTRILLFTRVTNKNTESISSSLHTLQVQQANA